MSTIHWLKLQLNIENGQNVMFSKKNTSLKIPFRISQNRIYLFQNAHTQCCYHSQHDYDAVFVFESELSTAAMTTF